MNGLLLTGERLDRLHLTEAEIELLAAMRMFDSFPLIALQRALSADRSTSGYRCSIPLYGNNPGKQGQLIATIDGDGKTAAEAINQAVHKLKARQN